MGGKTGKYPGYLPLGIYLKVFTITLIAINDSLIDISITTYTPVYTAPKPRLDTMLHLGGAYTRLYTTHTTDG